MVDMIDMAGAILANSESRLEVVSSNVANTGTVGYKRQTSFTEIVERLAAGQSTHRSNISNISRATDFSAGRMTQTGNPLDLAISDMGFFQLRRGDSVYYSRQGQYALDADNRVVTAQGYALQTADGADLTLPSINVEILEDGTVLDGELPIAKIGVFKPSDEASMLSVGGSMFAIEEAQITSSEAPGLRQGMVENANVVLSDEMIEMMAALRQAEIGARLVQTYDTLMGQAISTFGQGSR